MGVLHAGQAASSDENLADRAKAYGIASYIVDGNDVVAVYHTAKEAVDRARAGEGPILIEAKSMRMRGHAQHDPAEYVPKEMFEYWKERDPIVLYEKFLTGEKLLDAKSKKEIEKQIETLLDKERDFAETSPMPPAEFAEQGVYCTGDECHKIAPKWERPKAEVTPPRSSIAAVWSVEGFGEGKGSGGKNAPIHFGDTAAAPEQEENEEQTGAEMRRLRRWSTERAKSAAKSCRQKQRARRRRKKIQHRDPAGKGDSHGRFEQWRGHGDRTNGGNQRSAGHLSRSHQAGHV